MAILDDAKYHQYPSPCGTQLYTAETERPSTFSKRTDPGCAIMNYCITVNSGIRNKGWKKQKQVGGRNHRYVDMNAGVNGEVH